MVNDVNKFIMPNGDEIDIDAINSSNVFNSIKDYRQRLKLDIITNSNGHKVPILKSGSIVMKPNGWDNEGNPIIEYETTTEDYTCDEALWSSDGNKLMIILTPSKLTSGAVIGNNIYLSDSKPTNFNNGYALWYDITNNVIKFTSDSGATWESNCSYPLGYGYADVNDNGWSGIARVFNTCGFIGYLYFIDKDIECILQKNNACNKYTTTTITTNKIEMDNLMDDNGCFIIGIQVLDDINKYSISRISYNDIHSVHYRLDVFGKYFDFIPICIIYSNGTTITDIKEYQPFIGTNLNDMMSGVIPTIIDTFVNGASGYRIWSDGYCEQWGRTGNKTNVAITLTKKMSDTNYSIQITVINSNGDQNWAATNITVNGFTLLDSENKEHSWKVSGYLAEGEY